MRDKKTNWLYKIVLATLFFFIAINSFRDVTELEDRSFILAMAISPSKNKNSSKNFLDVTTLSSDLKLFQNDDVDNKRYVKSSCAKDINSAIKKINSQLEKKIYLGHTQIIFIDNRLRKNKCCLEKISNNLEANNYLNQKIKIMFVPNAKKIIAAQFSPKLLDFVKNKASDKTITIDQFYSLFHHRTL